MKTDDPQPREAHFFFTGKKKQNRKPNWKSDEETIKKHNSERTAQFFAEFFMYPVQRNRVKRLSQGN